MPVDAQGSRMSTEPLELDSRPILAVVTMVYNERDMLPWWIRHYSRHVSPEHIYIVDHGSDDGSTSGLGAVNVIRIPRSPLDDRRRTEAMALLTQSLLKWYQFVACVDSDELLVPDPEIATSLPEFCRQTSLDVVTSIGLNVLHRMHHDIDIRPGELISSQRRHVLPTSSMCKPSLIRRPVAWAPGFHCYDGPPQFAGLFNFHLAYFDYITALSRQEKRRRSPVVGNPDPDSFHHYFSDLRLRSTFEAWSQFACRPDTTLRNDCPTAIPFCDRIMLSYEVFKSSEYNIDLSIFGDELWVIPERFVGIF